jgi:hypothetical protein
MRGWWEVGQPSDACRSGLLRQIVKNPPVGRIGQSIAVAVGVGVCVGAEVSVWAGVGIGVLVGAGVSLSGGGSEVLVGIGVGVPAGSDIAAVAPCTVASTFDVGVPLQATNVKLINSKSIIGFFTSSEMLCARMVINIVLYPSLGSS